MQLPVEAPPTLWSGSTEYLRTYVDVDGHVKEAWVPRGVAPDGGHWLCCWRAKRDPVSGKHFFVNLGGLSKRWRLPDIYAPRAQAEINEALATQHQQQQQQPQQSSAAAAAALPPHHHHDDAIKKGGNPARRRGSTPIPQPPAAPLGGGSGSTPPLPASVTVSNITLNAVGADESPSASRFPFGVAALPRGDSGIFASPPFASPPPPQFATAAGGVTPPAAVPTPPSRTSSSFALPPQPQPQPDHGDGGPCGFGGSDHPLTDGTTAAPVPRGLRAAAADPPHAAAASSSSVAPAAAPPLPAAGAFAYDDGTWAELLGAQRAEDEAKAHEELRKAKDRARVLEEAARRRSQAEEEAFIQRLRNAPPPNLLDPPAVNPFLGRQGQEREDLLGSVREAVVGVAQAQRAASEAARDGSVAAQEVAALLEATRRQNAASIAGDVGALKALEDAQARNMRTDFAQAGSSGMGFGASSPSPFPGYGGGVGDGAGGFGATGGPSTRSNSQGSTVLQLAAAASPSPQRDGVGALVVVPAADALGRNGTGNGAVAVAGGGGGGGGGGVHGHELALMAMQQLEYERKGNARLRGELEEKERLLAEYALADVARTAREVALRLKMLDVLVACRHREEVQPRDGGAGPAAGAPSSSRDSRSGAPNTLRPTPGQWPGSAVAAAASSGSRSRHVPRHPLLDGADESD